MYKTGFERDDSFLNNAASAKAEGIVIDKTADIHPNAYFEGNITIGRYVRIEAGVILSGDISIGDYTVIRANSALRKNVTVGKNVQIFEQVLIEVGRPDQYCENPPDRALISDNCMIGPGSVMHGPKLGEGTIIGMKCALDYNTRTGSWALMANGTGAMVDSIFPDNCFIEGSEGKPVSHNISDTERNAHLGYDYKKRLVETASELEHRYKNNLRLADRVKQTSLKIHQSAYIHPTAILEGSIEVGENANVGPGSILCGDIKLGAHVQVGINSVIKGAVTLGDNTRVLDGVLLDGSVNPITIGKGCMVNHGAMVRACLADNAVVQLAAAVDYNSSVTEGPAGPPDCPGPDIMAGDREKRGPVKRNVTIAKTAFVHPTVWLEGDICIGEYAYIDAGSILAGSIEIGENSLLRLNCTLRGTIKIGKHTNILGPVSIADCVIGDRCKVNHGAVMRGTQMEDASFVHLGAVCEYNTKLQTGAVLGTCSHSHEGQLIPENTLAIGSPAIETRKDLGNADRNDYFGLDAEGWLMAKANMQKDELKGT